MQPSGNPLDSLREAREYRTTWMDRHGPDGAFVFRMVPWLSVTFTCCLGLFWALSQKGAIRPWMILPLASITSAGVAWVGLRFGTLAGRGLASFIYPSGDSTPYENQFSLQEAMAIRGDVAGALQSYEDFIATTPFASPSAIEARVRAAELYIRSGNDHRRAAELFRQVQRAPDLAPTRDIYVSNRLMDLYSGKLGEPGRALVELRRLIDRYPGTDTATRARDALARLKREAEQRAG